MKCNSYNIFFKNFANDAKLSIIMCLQKKPMNVGRIARSVGQEQSAVSHNLQKLMLCKIVDVERKGKKRIYSLNKETIMPLLELVEKHRTTMCCNGCVK